MNNDEPSTLEYIVVQLLECAGLTIAAAILGIIVSVFMRVHYVNAFLGTLIILILLYIVGRKGE